MILKTQETQQLPFVYRIKILSTKPKQHIVGYKHEKLRTTNSDINWSEYFDNLFGISFDHLWIISGIKNGSRIEFDEFEFLNVSVTSYMVDRYRSSSRNNSL